MAEGLDLSELVRRTVQANARFYKGWVDLSLEYFRGITEIFGGVPESAAGEASLETGAGALVLEGEAGATPSGAFLVTNDLGRTIRCELVTTEFRDSDGNAFPARATFDPASFDLAPGEQRVVRAALTIDGKLAPGVAYAGAFGIKGMDGFSVPAVVRRQHRVDQSPIERVATEPVRGRARKAKPEERPGPRTSATTTAPGKSARKRRRKKQ